MSYLITTFAYLNLEGDFLFIFTDIFNSYDKPF